MPRLLLLLLLLRLPPGADAACGAFSVFDAPVEWYKVFLSLILLMTFTALFEFGLHKLHHLTHHKKQWEQIVHKATTEFMILGFLAFAVLMLEEFYPPMRSPTLTSPVKDAILMFELAHLLLFLVGVLYVVHAVVFTFELSKFDHFWEDTLRMGPAAALAQLNARSSSRFDRRRHHHHHQPPPPQQQEALERRSTWSSRGPCPGYWLNRLICGTDRSEMPLRLILVRNNFITANADRYGIDDAFDFSAYVHASISKFVGDYIEVDWQLWIGSSALVGLLWLLLWVVIYAQKEGDMSSVNVWGAPEFGGDDQLQGMALPFWSLAVSWLLLVVSTVLVGLSAHYDDALLMSSGDGGGGGAGGVPGVGLRTVSYEDGAGDADDGEGKTGPHGVRHFASPSRDMLRERLAESRTRLASLRDIAEMPPGVRAPTSLPLPLPRVDDGDDDDDDDGAGRTPLPLPRRNSSEGDAERLFLGFSPFEVQRAARRPGQTPTHKTSGRSGFQIERRASNLHAFKHHHHLEKPYKCMLHAAEVLMLLQCFALATIVLVNLAQVFHAFYCAREENQHLPGCNLHGPASSGSGGNATATSSAASSAGSGRMLLGAEEVVMPASGFTLEALAFTAAVILPNVVVMFVQQPLIIENLTFIKIGTQPNRGFIEDVLAEQEKQKAFAVALVEKIRAHLTATPYHDPMSDAGAQLFGVLDRAKSGAIPFGDMVQQLSDRLNCEFSGREQKLLRRLLAGHRSSKEKARLQVTRSRWGKLFAVTEDHVAVCGDDQDDAAANGDGGGEGGGGGGGGGGAGADGEGKRGDDAAAAWVRRVELLLGERGSGQFAASAGGDAALVEALAGEVAALQQERRRAEEGRGTELQLSAGRLQQNRDDGSSDDASVSRTQGRRLEEGEDLI